MTVRRQFGKSGDTGVRRRRNVERGACIGGGAREEMLPEILKVPSLPANVEQLTYS